VSLFDIANLEKELIKLEEETIKENFWMDQKNSQIILNKIKTIKGKCTKFRKEEKELNNLLDLIELIKKEYDEELAKEVLKNINNLEQYTSKLVLDVY